MKTSSLLLTFVLISSASLGVGRADAKDNKKQKQQSYRLGKLHEGLSFAAVKKLLGKPKTLGKAVLQGATGEYVRDAAWPKRGLTLGLAAGQAKGPWKVASIDARKPCKLKTGRGIALGASRKAVQRAYPKYDKRQTNAHQYIAGSIYGGMIFRFDKQKRVTSIFIGAAAE